MSHKQEYDLSKDVDFKLIIDGQWCYVSIYHDRRNCSIAFDSNREKIKGLADFIYQAIGEKND